MAGQNAKGKLKYESPILVPLGEMAKGSGVCTVGSSVAVVACSPGPADAAVIDCTAGPTATRDCTAGTTALRDCTAGVAATGTTCSAGDHAASCTAGSLHV
jgi:hypothetical protein